MEFRAKANSLLPSAIPLELELVLEMSGESARHYPMKLVEGVYQAQAVPFLKRKGPLVFRVEVKYVDGSVAGVVEDLEFKVKGQPVKLSQIDHMRLGPKGKIKLATGNTLEGSLSELDSVVVKVGKQSLRLDLASAVEVKVDSPSEEAPVSCIVLARQAGKEVGRLAEPLYIEGSLLVSMEALRDGKFIKPPRSSNPVSYLRAISTKGD